MGLFFIILVIFLGLFAFLVWRAPKLAVYLILFSLPAYLIRFQIFSIPFTLLEAMILILFGIFFFRNIRMIRIGWWWIPCSLLLIASVIALFVSPDFQSGLGLFKAYIAEPMLFFIVCINLLETKDFDHITTALGFSACLIAGIALFQYFTGFGIPDPWHEESVRRATSVYGYPNAVGLYLAPLTALFFAKLVHRRTTRAFACVVICCGLLGILASRTEGALIAVFIGAFFSLFLTKHWRLAGGAFALFLLLGFLVPQSRQVLLFQDVSGDVRLALWKGTWNLVQTQPLVGAGLAGFPMIYDRFRLPSHVELLQYPHNIFFDFWVELGILGLLWLIGINVWYFFAGIRAMRSDPPAAWIKILLAPMVATLIYGFVDVLYFKNDLSVLFWTWLALMIISLELYKNQKIRYN